MMRLAERLGATTARLNASDMTAEVLAYARRNNVTQIVIGRSKAGFVDRLLGRSLSRDLVLRARGLSILVVAPETEAEAAREFPWPAPGAVATWNLAAAVAVALAILIGLGLERLTQLPNLSMIFLFAVLTCAVRFGTWSAVSASVLSFFAYNFFFIAPRHTFTVAEPHELFSLAIFLVVAIATGTLAGRLREQAMATRERAEATQSLFDFSAKLSGAAKLDDVIWLLASQTAAVVKGQSIILTPDSQDLAIAGGWPPESTLGTARLGGRHAGPSRSGRPRGGARAHCRRLVSSSVRC